MKQIALITSCLALLCSCAGQRATQADPTKLASINLVDRHGMSESITDKERLQRMDYVDFSRPQQYDKVLRVYHEDAQGNTRSVVTSYHDNGQLQQQLEVLNARAYGPYREWYPSGALKIEANIVGGEPDISPAAQNTWLIDGLSKAYDENGKLEAKIPYENGAQHGIARYFHPNGNIWKTSPFTKGQKDGEELVYLESGELFASTEYRRGKRHGTAVRYWAPALIALKETYADGLLVDGSYFTRTGTEVSKVVSGNGFKAVFGADSLYELQEYRSGKQEGEVKRFNEKGELTAKLSLKDNNKHGEEVLYFESGEGKGQPKLSIEWVDGKIHGEVRSWYPSGQIESRREMSNNTREGLSSVWYEDGSIMMIEDYERDFLVKGEYRKRGETLPVSRVLTGKGTATIFDGKGKLVQKVDYDNGRPLQ